MALLHEPRGARILARNHGRFAMVAVLVAASLLVPTGTGWADDVSGAGSVEVVPEPPESTPEPRPQVRLRGEVVETGCFVIGGRRGQEHEQCAIACARAGQDLGILDERTKRLHLAVVDRRSGPAENPLLPFIAHRVEVRGEVLEYGELPAVIVSDVRSLGRPR